MCSCKRDHFGEPCPSITLDADRIAWEKAQREIDFGQMVALDELDLAARLDLLWMLWSHCDRK